MLMDLDHSTLLHGAERAADGEARKPEASTAPSIVRLGNKKDFLLF